MTILYVKGDATKPDRYGPKIIAHICNNEGVWGAGFVLAVSRRWPEPEADYRFRQVRVLGKTHFVKVADDLYVANMIAQTLGDAVPVKYDALEKCLDAVRSRAKRLCASVHMPRIGCGLGGGDWRDVEKIVQKTLCKRGVHVTVYDL
jgi:O-acetyl-ADP-ribose deacetylase (regulator of RNase III)